MRMRERVRRPRREFRGRRRLSPMSVNRMVPNVLTLLALCAGMTAIRYAVSGEFPYAAFAIIAAGVFDGLDGRLARLLKATSPFGAELDSLADFISFGVAPAAVLYLWTMQQLHSIGWAIVLFYAVCCALRLARFNAQLGADPPPWRANFFTGVPAPAGAGLLMWPMFISFQWGDWIIRSPYLNAVWIGGVALTMVSTIPTFSLKRLRIPPHYVVPSLLVIGVMTAFFTTAPWPTLTLVGAIYLVSIPLTVRASWRMRQALTTARPAETAAAAPPLPATLTLPLPDNAPAATAPAANAPAANAPAANAPAANEWRH
jgi:CDP-diacylglycerol--serine O-phosphatidyltransferase